MKAEEMFKELDYDKTSIDSVDEEIVYNFHAIDTSSYYRYISFDLKSRRIEMDDNSTEPFYLSLKELQAINKQICELGWNNED